MTWSGIIVALSFLAVCGAFLIGVPVVPLLSIAWSVKGWRELGHERSSVIGLAALSLALWAGLSFGMSLLFLSVMMAGEGYPPGTDLRDVVPLWWSFTLIGSSLLYVGVGGLLVYSVVRQMSPGRRYRRAVQPNNGMHPTANQRAYYR